MSPPAEGLRTRSVPHTRMRRAVARTVTASAAVPQFSVETEADATVLREVREHLRKRDVEVSLTDLLHLAVARTLTGHPLLNASHTDEATLLHEAVNLAFIVEVADGMLTPVIPGADGLSAAGLAAARTRLTERALGGRLGPGELLTGTFTVSNLGPFGVRRFTAMVLPPQSAVLAVGSADERQRISLTLSVDHRVADGAAAARFLGELHRNLEDFAWITTRCSTPESAA